MLHIKHVNVNYDIKMDVSNAAPANLSVYDVATEQNKEV